MRHLSKITTVAVLGAFLASSAQAGPVSFSNWKQHWFSRLADVDFKYGSSKLSVTANEAVSITYRVLPKSEQGAQSASWSWAVDQSVPATDLRRKGGDDRNLALYFAFLPQAQAAKVKGSGNIRSLLNNPDGRVLVYVWGGNHGRGQALPSPYLGSRGKTIVLRGAGAGSYSEQVNLAADYAKAFGTAPEALVALAVSSDSDDTDTKVVGQISSLTLR